ncbi:MAG: EpsG family protein [Hafnia sp.]
MNDYKVRDLNLEYFSCATFLVAGAFFYPLPSILLLALVSPLLPRQFNRLCVPVVVIFLTVFYSSITPVNDWVEYLKVYHGIQHGEISPLRHKNFGGGLEIGYPLFMLMVGTLSGYNDYALFFASYALIFWLVAKFTEDLDPKFRLSFITFACLGITFLIAASYVIRQIVSVLLFLIAIQSSSRRNICTLFFLSAAFHISSIINIGVFLSYAFFSNQKIPKQYKLLGFLLLITPLSFFLTKSLSYISEKFQNIQQFETNQNTIAASHILLVILNTMLIGLALNIKSRSTAFFLLLLLKECLLFFALLPFPTLSFRLGLIIYAFPFFFIKDFLNNQEANKSIKHLIYFLMIFINFAPSIYALHLSSQELNSLNFFNSQAFSSNILDITAHALSTIQASPIPLQLHAP